MNRSYTVAILCIIALTGCATGHRYQLSKDDTGRLVRLDTQTGEVMLVEGDKLTPIKGTGTNTAETGSQNEELPPVKLPDGGKSWPTITMPDLGNAKAELTSYWHNGKLHYVIELHPFSKRLKLLYSGYYTNPSLSLQLNNASGKQVAWTSLPTKQMKHTINKMRNVEELSGEGVITTSKEHYDSIAGWQLYWNPR